MSSASKKRNAFFHFMVQRKKELEAQGQSFPGGLKDVATAVSDEWKSMSFDEKRRFDHDGKMGDQPTEPKESSPPPRDMRPFEKVEYEMAKRLQLEEAVFDEIAKLLQPMEVENTVFILMDFNVYSVDNDDLHFPAEIGMLAFSLTKGIIDEFGTIIDPGEIPLGLNSDVLNTIDDLQLPQLPFDSDPMARNFRTLLNTIVRFINKYTDHLSPGWVFCRSEKTGAVSSCLQWITQRNGLEHTFKVYSLEHLLIHICRIRKSLTEKEDSSSLPNEFRSNTESEMPTSSRSVLHPTNVKADEEKKDFEIPSLAEVARILNSVVLAGHAHFGCFHHMKYCEVVHKCALAKVNRYAYYALGLLLPRFDIKPEPCRHFHEETLSTRETTFRVLMLNDWGLMEVFYPTFEYPEERKARRDAERAFLSAQEFHARGGDASEPPMAFLAPLFRRPKVQTPFLVLGRGRAKSKRN